MPQIYINMTRKKFSIQHLKEDIKETNNMERKIWFYRPLKCFRASLSQQAISSHQWRAIWQHPNIPCANYKMIQLPLTPKVKNKNQKGKRTNNGKTWPYLPCKALAIHVNLKIWSEVKRRGRQIVRKEITLTIKLF